MTASLKRKIHELKLLQTLKAQHDSGQLTDAEFIMEVDQQAVWLQAMGDKGC